MIDSLKACDVVDEVPVKQGQGARTVKVSMASKEQDDKFKTRHRREGLPWRSETTFSHEPLHQVHSK